MTVRVPIYNRAGVCAHALIDAEDAERVAALRWRLVSKGHALAWLRDGSGEAIYMHRLVLNLPPKTGIVHHKNHDKLDNRRANLEVVETPLEHARLHFPHVPYCRLARAVAVAASLEIRRTRHDYARWQRGCRCDVCAEDQRQYFRDYRRGIRRNVAA